MAATNHSFESSCHFRKRMGVMESRARFLAHLAIRALIEETELTPKPGLVDRRGAGAHTDLSLDLMRCSANALEAGFEQMALAAYQAVPGQILREELGFLGRAAEEDMLRVTGGINTHRGAIWILGLLVAGAATGAPSAEAIGAWAGKMARYPDRFAPSGISHGLRVVQRYQVAGARGEALLGFPHIMQLGLPGLHAARSAGAGETKARLNALLSIMSSLDDTCLLHRGGPLALLTAKSGAGEVLGKGGAAFPAGWRALLELDKSLLALRVSPGGSADLLAGTLFLDSLTAPQTTFENIAWKN
jgi:triphosphoribosyl-dephospho-CoA synthase